MKPIKIALFSASGLGDGLLTMILSHNLSQNGHSPVLFNTNLSYLSDWFPDKILLPFPKDIDKDLEPFDLIITTDHTPLANKKDSRLLILKESHFDKKKTMVENFIMICREKLLLSSVTHDNGLKLPKEIQKGQFNKRIALHPTSSNQKKNWPKEKFLYLAHKLADAGFEPSICVAHFEREHWLDCQSKKITLPYFATLKDFASHIAESGFLIGNDSGIGHLASNIGVPTLTLFARKSNAFLWRPGWNRGFIITPPPLVLGARAKEILWKRLLSVNRVYQAFIKATI